MIFKLILTIIFLWIFFWAVLEFLDRKKTIKLGKKYKKDDDKSREETDGRITGKKPGFRGSNKPKGRKLLSASSSSSESKTGSSTGKNRGFNKFLENLKQK